MIILHLTKRVPGVRTRIRSKATTDAYRVFFIVAMSVPPIFSGVELHRINGGAGRAAFGLAGSL
ncbi:hypothetical protein AN674_0214235 [Enterobacter kobei]|nr:hypothetical protein AN674_0214235 [Enterobacter kobei]